MVIFQHQHIILAAYKKRKETITTAKCQSLNIISVQCWSDWWDVPPSIHSLLYQKLKSENNELVSNKPIETWVKMHRSTQILSNLLKRVTDTCHNFWLFFAFFLSVASNYLQFLNDDHVRDRLWVKINMNEAPFTCPPGTESNKKI